MASKQLTVTTPEPSSNSKYDPKYDDVAYKACLLTGGSDSDLAFLLDVSENTIRTWRATHPSFKEACERGKSLADFAVAEAAYKRATGYEVVTERAIKVKRKDGVEEVEIVQVSEEVPADPQTIQYWLNNRQRKHWRSANKIEVSGPDGGPIQHRDLTLEELAEEMRLRGLPTAVLEN